MLDDEGDEWFWWFKASRGDRDACDGALGFMGGGCGYCCSSDLGLPYAAPFEYIAEDCDACCASYALEGCDPSAALLWTWFRSGDGEGSLCRLVWDDDGDSER